MLKDQQRRFWNPKIETMSRDEMRALQMVKLKSQLIYNYENSLFYRKKFEEAGIKPEDIRTPEDFQHIPLTNKDEQRKAQEASIENFGHPYGRSTITCAPSKKSLE